MDFPSSFQILSSNVKGGLSILSKSNSNFRSSGISYKINEVCSYAGNIPTIFCLSETKLKAGSSRIKLPRHVKYVGESSNQTSTAGILVFCDKRFEIENPNDVISIATSNAMYVKVKYGTLFIELIILYLPSKTKECIAVLKKVESFIDSRSLTNFSLLGDLNIDFNSPNHTIKIIELQRLLQKYNLFNLANKLGINPKYTFRGGGERSQYMSYIDHFFVNFNIFKSIKYEYNSYSDHKTMTAIYTKNFLYTPPSWKSYLFRKDEFISMMKRETISFLYIRAKKCYDHDLEYYLNNPHQADIDFQFKSNKHYIETKLFFDLLRHLKQHHDKYFSKLKLKNFEQCKTFHSRLSSLYNEIDSGNSIFSLQDVKEIVQQQQNFFREMSHNQAEFKLLRKLYQDGGCNAYTFKYINRNKKHDFNVKINNVFTNDSKLIGDTLSKMHASVVSNSNIPKSTVHKLLADYDLSLQDVFPKICSISSPKCSTLEFKNALKTMSNTSCPGISTEPKILYEFLLNLMPNFVTKALNNLYDIDLDTSEFSFIKDRNILFIPKRGNDLTDLSNFRPISLLETVYKLITKTLNIKLTAYLPKIVSSDQHGFMKGRQMSNASLAMVATIKHSTKNKDNVQLVSFDFKKAFESILPEVVSIVLKYIFPCGTFAKSLISLFNGGRFRVLVNNYVSMFVQIYTGGAQGGPLTASIFIMIAHIFVACLNSVKIRKLAYKIGDIPLQPVLYADDVYQFFQFLSNSHIDEVKTLLSKLEYSIGLKINFDKTKIIVQGEHPNQLYTLGKICEHFQHLGLQISFDLNKAHQLTYQKLFKTLENRAKNVHMKADFNLFKRRNLCSSLMNSLCYHIYRIFPPHKNDTDRLWKSISSFLWSTKKTGNTSSRIKISQKRVELHYLDGGLNILKPEQQSFSIFLTSFFSALNHASKYPGSLLGIIFAYHKIPVNKIISNFGFQTITKFINVFRQIYPSKGGSYFEKACSFFYDLECNSKTMLCTPLTTSHWSNIRTPFNANDEKLLSKCNLFTFASILETVDLRNNVCFLPKIKPEIHNLVQNVVLLEKLNNLIEAAKSSIPRTNNYNKAQIKKLNILMGTLAKSKPSTFSFHFKRIYRESIIVEHPAIKTRLRDSIYFPDNESFQNSFKKLFSLPIPIHFKNFFYEQYSRTLNSKNKMYKFKLTDSNICVKCKVISNTEHALFQCHFAKYFIHVLALFIDDIYDSQDFVTLKENFYLYNIYYDHFSIKEYTQLSLLILVGKERCLKISKDDCILRWSIPNYYAQSLLISNFTSQILLKSGIENSFISLFYDYMIHNKNKLMSICTNNI